MVEEDFEYLENYDINISYVWRNSNYSNSFSNVSDNESDIPLCNFGGFQVIIIIQ